MTYLLIHHKVNVRREKLLQMASLSMQKEFRTITELLDDPDTHYIEQPEHVSIKIDDVKRLMKEMVYKPFSGTMQIGVIFHAHMLTVEAQNALLKTLEEQPDATSYFLLVNSENSVLPTIASRSTKIYVMEDILNREEVLLDDLSVEILGLPLLEQFKEVERLVESDKEERGVIKFLFTQLLRSLREELTVAMSNSEGNVASIKQQVEIVMTASERYDANVNKRLLLENMCLQLEKLRA